MVDKHITETALSPSSAKLFVRRFMRNKLAVFCLFLLLVFLGSAIFAPWLAPTDPTRGELRLRLQPPSSQHLLGTDQHGRDVLSRIIWGSRITLVVPCVAIGIGMFFGTILGLLSGYYGGIIDTVIMRVMDILLSFPQILLIIGIVSVMGPNFVNAMIAIGIRMIPNFARLVRSVVLTIRNLEYVQAAQALGVSEIKIIFLHVLPNSLTPLIVQATLLSATAILSESTLSFLGMGVQPPTPAWGSMVAAGQTYLMIHPHLSIIPGLVIMVVVYSINVCGDVLRDLLDPRITD